MVDWGDVPGWVEAIGTSSAFLIAAVTYARDRRHKRRAQAQQISSWFTVDEIRGYELKLSNPSDLPIYDVFVDLKAFTVTAAPIVPPNTAEFNLGGLNYFLNLYPELAEDSNRSFPLDGEPVSILFRDASRQGWAKDSTGELMKLKSVDYAKKRAEMVARRQRLRSSADDSSQHPPFAPRLAHAPRHPQEPN